MSKYLTILVLILLLLLGTVGYFAWQFKEKADRMEENYLAGQGVGVNTLNLTSKEFKELLKANNDSLLKKVSDSLKMTIRPRNVNQVNNYRYYYVDTTITQIPLTEIDNIYPFEYNNGCLKIEGNFDIIEGKMLLSRKEFQDSIIDVSGGKRALVMKWLFGGIRIGKKEPFNIILSSCDGVITKKEINIIH
jgi:hypothetical protein